MRYTQDESYYLLDAQPEASVYLGVKTGTDPQEMGCCAPDLAAGGNAV